MRRILRVFLFLIPPHPNPLPLEREFSLLTVGGDFVEIQRGLMYPLIQVSQLPKRLLMLAPKFHD
jgi:hypothetical protein